MLHYLFIIDYSSLNDIPSTDLVTL